MPKLRLLYPALCCTKPYSLMPVLEQKRPVSHQVEPENHIWHVEFKDIGQGVGDSLAWELCPSSVLLTLPTVHGTEIIECLPADARIPPLWTTRRVYFSTEKDENLAGNRTSQ